MTACPHCASERPQEQLRDAWQVCPACGLAYRLDADGYVVEWATTNRSHPKGVWAVDMTVQQRGAHDSHAGAKRAR